MSTVFSRRRALAGAAGLIPAPAIAVLAALDESIATINADRRAAVTLWKDVH
jgi:hypothetical protein